MDLNLTLDMIYDLPNKVMSNSETNENEVALIPIKECKEYNITEIKSKLSRMFSKFLPPQTADVIFWSSAS